MSLIFPSLTVLHQFFVIIFVYLFLSFIFLCDSSVPSPSTPPQTACLMHTSNQTKPFDHGSLHLHVCEQRERLFSSLNRQANFRVPSVLVSSWVSVFLSNYL